MLGKYDGFAAADKERLDQMWAETDVDMNGLLDKAEAKNYLAKLKEIVSAERAANYSEDNFERVFNVFDEDKNGFLTKSEMAVLIKKLFAKPKILIAKMEKPADAKKVKLTYCNAYGVAEPVRMMLCKSGVDFEDERADDKEFCCCLPDGEVLKDVAAVYMKIANQCGCHEPDAEGQKDIKQLVDDF